MRGAIRVNLLAAAIAGAALSAGCAAAVGAGAGAAAAIHLSDRGVESLVRANVDKAQEAARKAFGEFNITETKVKTETESGRNKRILEGTAPDREITVTITTEGDGSKVEVVARKSAVTWDKDYAKAILQRVISLAA